MEGKFILPIILLAFGCELVDSTLGMGYGTTLTPILLALGFPPIEIVPAVLISEFVTGVTAGLFHHEFGNVNLKPGSRDSKITVVLSVFSTLGVIVSVFIAVHLPEWMVKLYIGLLVTALGFTIMIRRNRNLSFSWKRICSLGFIAAFNKGISGGGYGPVVTAGQVLSGVRGRNAVGIASLAEGLTSLIGVIVYLINGTALPWNLAAYLMIGAMLSVPLAAYSVSRIPAGRLTLLIGGISTTIGGYTLIKLVI